MDADAGKAIEDLIRELIRMGISQTKAIMHITAAMGYDQTITPDAKEQVTLARNEIDTMIDVIDVLAKRYASEGRGNE